MDQNEFEIKKGDFPPGKIPVIEEEIQIRKETVETGKVRLIKKVQDQDYTVDLTQVNEEVDIERVAIDKYVESAPGIRYEGETIIIPILQEVMVVEKRLVLKEELRVTKRKSENKKEGNVTLRKEEVIVERIPSKEKSEEIN